MIFRPFDSEPLSRKGIKPNVLNSTWNSTKEEDSKNYTLAKPGLDLFEPNTTSSAVNITSGAMFPGLAGVLTSMLNSTKGNKTDDKS